MPVPLKYWACTLPVKFWYEAVAVCMAAAPDHWPKALKLETSITGASMKSADSSWPFTVAVQKRRYTPTRVTFRVTKAMPLESVVPAVDLKLASESTPPKAILSFSRMATSVTFTVAPGMPYWPVVLVFEMTKGMELLEEVCMRPAKAKLVCQPWLSQTGWLALRGPQPMVYSVAFELTNTGMQNSNFLR